MPAKPPPLYWIASRVDGVQRYLLQEATTPLYAALRASIAGFPCAPPDVIALDAGTARKVPKKMIGRVLSQREAEALLKKLT